jgi:hypothetical protein
VTLSVLAKLNVEVVLIGPPVGPVLLLWNIHTFAAIWQFVFPPASNTAQ